MSYDILKYNLRIDTWVFQASARPWLIPSGTESCKASWHPMGLGVFSGRGKPLALFGGTGASPLAKRERGLPGTPNDACGQPERELLARPLVDFPLWGVPFFLGQNLSRGPMVPRTGTPFGGSTRKSGARSPQESHPPPAKGLGRWDKTPQKPPVEREKQESKTKKKSCKKNRTAQEEKNFLIKTIYSNLEYRQYLE